jgi:hypothetical protein
VRDLLRVKLKEVGERLRLLEEFKNTLSRHLVACERSLKEDGDAAECPVLTYIARGEMRKGTKR